MGTPAQRVFMHITGAHNVGHACTTVVLNFKFNESVVYTVQHTLI